MRRSSADKPRGLRHSANRLSLELAARDPARARLIVATAVALGVLTSALLAQFVIRQSSTEHALLVVAIFLSVQAGSMVKDHSAFSRFATAVLLVPAVVLAILVAAVLSENRILAIAVFVAISGGAVWIRRFGERAASLGAIAFMGYFFMLFMKPSSDELFAFCLIAAIAVGTQSVVRAALLLKRPRRELAVLLREFRAASEAAIAATSRSSHAPVLRSRIARIDAISGAIWSWQQSFRTERHIAVEAQILDDRVLDARVDTEEACFELVRIAGSKFPTPPDLYVAIARLRAILDESASVQEVANATSWAEEVIARESLEQNDTPDLAVAEYLIARSVMAQVRLRRIDLTQGLTSGSPARANLAQTSDLTVSSTSRVQQAGGKPRRRSGQWAPTSRMAAQVMIATAIASGVGEMISASRWYWAVMTAFVIFIGATTRSSILTRAFRRIVGTIFGIGAGIVIVYLAGENANVVIAICVLAVFGMLYFGPLNYLYSALFMTIMLVSMYRLLGVLNGSVLELRLDETIAGALIGVLCAYLIMSTNSRPVLLVKANGYVDALDEVLNNTVANLRTPTSGQQRHASLHALEVAQSDLAQAVSSMVTAFLVTAPRQETTAVHLMYIVTRSAARLVQIDSAAVCAFPRVIHSTAAVTETMCELRRVLVGARLETDRDGGPPLAQRLPLDTAVDPRSAEAEALMALGRMRWALEQLVSAWSARSVGSVRTWPGR